MRDEFDLPFEQFTLDAFASFARTHNPNPDKAFLVARGFAGTLRQAEAAGPWVPATNGAMTMRVLDWPSYQSPWREGAQCEALKLGLHYYG